ncbi:disulfide bond formation protein DsbB [Shewanella sedimentimangrovi]|uniref:Disulfide bond formation protein B n=1 Tax=Shewanella sedimentimangrovi TaxID=2814293 RepID=A0ABX7R6J0_9GAMM|nr:disulfide bond formation protein DsbB [Shewanella sedimentimangrovi]QSX38756.1 disulfide bond formation protein DsbB [Shewanella sedimentimangrovi]
MFSKLTRFAHGRLAWGLLALTALGLELSALYFQYGMKLDPCVMCIYIRLAVLGLLLAGIIGMIAPTLRPVRILASLLWGASAVWGVKLSMELVDIQTNPSPFATCSFLPEFPGWMPLHDWLPSVFMPTGMCTDIPWEFAGVTMAQWMIVAFATFLAALALFLVPVLKKQA